ncbi:MAG: hypothetical protein HY553_04540 [Elusimicrobia bacterium]|nr:hypothetical protein [Elusimicrobiota bacterium]
MNALIIAAMLVAAPCLAEDAPPAPARSAWADVKKWLGELRTAISESAVTRHQKQKRGALAVAAVRGHKQLLDDPAKPYWKGTAATKQEREERRERAELAAALDLALEGKNEAATAALDAFEAAHPNSALLADCRQAREKLKAAEAPAAEEAAPPPMPGTAANSEPAPVQADEEKK